MKKKGQKIKFLLAGLLSVLLIGAALSWYYRAKIIRWVKHEVSNTLHMDIEFSSLNLSLIRDFPKITLSFHALSLSGKDEFEGVTLMETETADLAINARSLWQGNRPIEIANLRLQKPIIHLIALDSNRANYLFYPEDTDANTPESHSPFALEFKNITIQQGQLSYEDRAQHTLLQFSNFNHKGKGSWEEGQLSYTSNTSLDSLNFRQGNVSYCKNLHITWDAALSFNTDEMRIAMGENKLQINALQLIVEGQAQSIDDRIKMDLQLNAPNNQFKELFSLLPSAYTSDYDDVQTKGTFSLSGQVRGEYDAQGHTFPDFDMKLSVANGYVHYPDFPKAIEEVSLQLQCVKQGGPSLDKTILDLSKLKFKIGDETLSINTHITRPLTRMNTRGTIKGSLNLRSLAEAYPIKDLRQMSGIIDVDLSYRFDRALSEKYLAGTCKSKTFLLHYDEWPKVAGKNVAISFSPDKILLEKGTLLVGRSDYSGSLYVANPLHYFTEDHPVRLVAHGQMSRFDTRDWITEEADYTQEVQAVDTAMYQFLTRRFYADIDLQIRQLVYPDYDIQSLSFQGRYAQDHLDIDQLHLLFFLSPVRVEGHLAGLLNTMWMGGVLSGQVKVNSDKMDLDKYFAASTSPPATASATESASALELPEKIDVNVDLKIPILNYEATPYYNIRGALHLGDRRVEVPQMKMDGLGGTMLMSGKLQTPKGEKPTFDMRYSIKRIDFAAMLQSVKSTKKIMPIFEYFKGAFHSDLKLSGQLNDDMSPVLTSLNAKGVLQTLHTYIENYPPIRQLGDKMHIQSLKEENIPVKDVKTWFEIVGGEVRFKPFVLRYKSMEIKVEGRNTLDKQIDYTITAGIPTEILQKMPGHATVKKSKDWLNTQLQKRNIDLSEKKRIQTRIHLTGPYNQPKVNIRLERVEGGNTLQEEAQKALEESKQKWIDSLQKVKDKEMEKAKDKAHKTIATAKDSAINKTREHVTKAKQKAKEEVQRKVGQYIDSTKIDSLTHNTKEKVKEEAKQKAKEVLDKWNPFKKKKGK